MIRAEYALLADYVNTADKGKLNILGVATRLNPPSYPFVCGSMFFVAKVEFDREDVGKDLNISLAWQDASGNRLAETPPMGVTLNFLDDDLDGQITIPTPPVIIPNAGIYTALFLVEGNIITKTSIISKPAPAAQSGA